MISSATTRARASPVIASAASQSCQRRTKAFVRRLDEKNEVFYTLERKGPGRDDIPQRQYDFFAMPDLLLDLDAEGSEGIRSFDETDERRHKLAWSTAPKRDAVRSTLKRMEKQVYESRRRAREIRSQPTNIFRITPHDVLSAALRGSRSSGPSGTMPMLEQIRIGNGIPPHAAEDDEQLLRWMMLSRSNLEESKRGRDEAAPVPSQLAEALRRQTSIEGIRRLVSQCLAAGTSVESFAVQPASSPNLPIEIRRACERVFKRDPTADGPRVAALTFIGNLSDRVSGLNGTVGASLYGLCLRLSAEAGMLDGTSEWLYRGFDNKIWNAGTETLQDVLFVLHLFRSRLGSTEKAGFGRVRDRQLLFQLLTGIDENDSISLDSFRSFALLSPNQDGAGPVPLAGEIYRCYIGLLGQLGAARTIWKEWRLATSRPDDGALEDGALEMTFREALGQVGRTMATADDETRPDLSLDECARRDYHAIEMQHVDSWRHAASGASEGRLEMRHVQELMSLPLEDWISKAKQLPS
ncbi:hypothetical protein DCS_01147 [Drechmeria coniospora]|uniref:Uncharacterized protein n=1 Tax=Drechmeria coniospora TaxID=98403 RepID=A0A151GSG5_DRECN|nr:hypothetical protein DCS_01147 [Drechmeria coniospora]KYK60013.1 hypothetical protein DCS_01147 [Drechmeria coniospora]ODA78812.1 hypothetical protein RJ55_06196 [Drechmeria coniospora]